ncbi:vanadium-dependent haloperoxidase [Candidatus Nitrosocosmicus hydrocola]|uniref:vanadium-dependent haloperoxidase n=1 Tax=Candidatus Nitrosocosmicus hydrocola TaxID=1826872 RepID=UPI000A556D81|nr:vanadium-dependent haloperoxidase [Candidatus Nitrosocosmicus hydrocola]
MTDREDSSYEGRIEAAKIARDRPIENNKSNGEENKYKDANGKLNYIANFTKGLKHHEKSHQDAGEVISEDYRDLRDAIQSEDPKELQDIILGGQQKFVNPEAAFAFDLEGPDSHHLAIKPAPTLDSEELAGEMGELYWMALCRDIPFSTFSTDPLIQEAAADLDNNYGDFPVVPNTDGGEFKKKPVDPSTIFRGMTDGDFKGEYISQFLIQDIQWGSQVLKQVQNTLEPKVDYLTDYGTWLKIQNGDFGNEKDTLTGNERYILTGRDLARYVHVDALYQAYLGACLILLHDEYDFDPNMPLHNENSRTTMGFGTFGGPHILSLVTEVATRALKCVWYQKWGVHRRLRPEAVGGLIHRQKNADVKVDPELTAPNPDYPLNKMVLESKVLDKVFKHNMEQNKNKPENFGTYLLPMAFKEGSPFHPSYGAGHATVAGACTTILKAWFDGEQQMKYHYQFEPDGTIANTHLPGNPHGLTVNDELNKVAANIAIGRNWAGVHYRKDYTESLILGEKVAIGVLQEQALCYEMDPKNPKGFFKCTLTKFDGSKIKFNGAKIEIL